MKTSSIINGTGNTTGTKKAITISSTSPANTLPKRRKEKDSTRIDSDNASKNQSTNGIMPEKLKKRFKYPPQPLDLIEKYWIEKTVTRASAKVVVRSLFGERNTDIWPLEVVI